MLGCKAGEDVPTLPQLDYLGPASAQDAIPEKLWPLFYDWPTQDWSGGPEVPVRGSLVPTSTSDISKANSTCPGNLNPLLCGWLPQHQPDPGGSGLGRSDYSSMADLPRAEQFHRCLGLTRFTPSSLTAFLAGPGVTGRGICAYSSRTELPRAG